MRKNAFAVGIFAFFAALFMMAGVVVEAETPTYLLSYATDADLTLTDADHAASDRFALDLNFSGEWSFSGNILRESKQRINGTTVMQLNLREGDSGEEDNVVSLQYDALCDLSGYYTLTFTVYIGTEDDDYAGYYPVKTSMTRGSRSLYSTAYVRANRWQSIVVDVSDCDWADSISISFDCGREKTPRWIRASSPYTGYEDRSSHIERYMTPYFEATNGKLKSAGETASLVPMDGTTRLEGRFAFNEPPTENTQAFLLVTLSGEISGGTLTASFLDASSANDVYTDAAALSLQNGRNVYSFPFTSAENLLAYRLSFRNAVCGGEGIEIESVSVLWTDYELPQSTGLGYISGVTLNSSGELVISGSVAQSALAERLRDELVVYAVPYTTELSNDQSDFSFAAKELLRGRISMNFELTVDRETAAQYVGAYRFFVVLEGKEGGALLAPPRGIDAASLNVGEMSIVGIEGASAVGVFESNSTHVIVDLPFDELILMAISSAEPGAMQNAQRHVTADDTTIYFNEELLESVLAEISFYNSARIEVYLRITDATGSFLENVVALNEKNLSVYSSILKFLLSREEIADKRAVSGIILGEAVAYTEQLYRETDVYAYTLHLAELMRVTYSAAYPYLDPTKFCVVLPVASGGLYNNAVYQMLSVQIERMGDMPWLLLYCFGSEETENGQDFSRALSEAQILLEASQAFGYGESAELTFCYEPDGNFTAETLSRQYEALCSAAEKYRPRTVFISIDYLNDSIKEPFYRLMKHVREEDKNSQIEEFAAEYRTETEEDDEETGRYALWDFQNVYYSNGWVAGGAISGCDVGWSGIFSDYNGVYSRALQTPIYPDYEAGTASGIVLRNFSRAIDLSSVDEVSFVFAIDGDAEVSTVIFTLGNESTRAEYSLSGVEPGVVHRVTCSLADYGARDAVSYIGVMAYSEDSASLEIETVEFGSDALTAQEIEALFRSASASDADKNYTVFYIAGVVGALSLCIFALMIRRDREEEEQRRERRDFAKRKQGGEGVR